ncbi:MAG: SDR family NAD(P)-dependent oxidoreductase [Hyphomicrobiales bacterium]
MLNVAVTGGSRGIGLAVASRLASAGYRVLAIARHEGEELKAAIGKAAEGKPAEGQAGSLHFVPFDLGDTKAIPDLVKGLRREFGALYGLVNNAALGTSGLLATMHNSQIESLLRLNTLSPIILTKYAVRSMMAQGRGRIVNISSVIGFTGFSGLAVYGATKASMLGFTRSLAREVGRLGINVNAVAPGFMDTQMTSGLGDDERLKVAGRSALRRLPEPQDVASAVEFLMGEGARNITGTVLTVDAGSTA